MTRSNVTLNGELRQIRSAFMQLARSFRRVGPLLAATNGIVEQTPARRKPRLSAAQRKALRLQGQYMGTMRGLKPRQRAQVKRTRAEKGIRSAIAEARRLVG